MDIFAFKSRKYNFSLTKCYAQQESGTGFTIDNPEVSKALSLYRLLSTKPAKASSRTFHGLKTFLIRKVLLNLHTKSFYMTQTTTLGSCIRMERKKAGLTQAQLGKLIGLGESRVSKIENGAPLTPETASFILNKLGSDIQTQVVNKRLEAESINFIMETILNFARTKSISLASAFTILRYFLNSLYRVSDTEEQ